MELGQKILEYRARHSLSMQEMADLCHVSKQTIWSIENGQQKPGKVVATKLWLVLREDEKQTNE